MRYIILTVLFSFLNIVYGQQKPIPHLTKESALAAKPICDLGLLNGQNYRNPIFVPTGKDNPLPCGTGGQLDNFLIFSFIANSTSIEITIPPQTCSPAALIGLQVAILQNLGSNDNCLFFFRNGGVQNTGFLGETDEIKARSDGFVIGNRYFLLIDGNGGSQCDFQIQVRNLTPATPPNLNNLASQSNILNRFEVIGKDSSRLKVDSIQYCIGVDSFTLEIPAGDLDLSYKWFFDPKPPNYPDTIFMDSISSLKKISFNQPGIYTLTNLASNKCSEVENKIKIYVGSPPKDTEDFGKINICSDKVQFLIDTLRLKDPNGDRFFGWGRPLGVVTDGIKIDSFKNIFNCTITQQLDLTIKPNDIPKDTIVSCGNYTLNGVNFETTPDGELLFVSGLLNANGCDSVTLRKVYIPAISGDINVTPCDFKGKSTLSFSRASASLPPNSKINYIWKDGQGNIIDDVDGIDTTFRASLDGTYVLHGVVSGENYTCTLDSITSYQFDKARLLPGLPQVVSNNFNICPADSTLEITLIGAQTNKFIWELPNGVVMDKSNSKGDTVKLKVRNEGEQSFTIKVTPENACGGGTPDSFRIQKYSTPKSTINLPTQICQDETFVLSGSKGNEVNWTYSWSLGKSQYLRGNVNSLDSLRLVYNSVVNDTISLSAQRGNCPLKVIDTKRIKVIPKLVDFPVNCDAQSTQIEFSWPAQDTNCVKQYVILKGDTVITRTKNLSYTIKNLNPNTLYSFQLYLENNCGCQSLQKVINCQTMSCASSKPDLTILTNEFCETTRDSIVRTNVLLPAGFNTGVLKFVGRGIDSLGRLNIKNLNVGVNKVLLNYQFMDCLNADSLEVTIHPLPTFDVELTQPFCLGEREGLYSVIPTNVNSFDILINNLVSSASGRLNVGSHRVGVRSDKSCITNKTITINPNIDASFEMQVPESIFKDQPLEAVLLLSDSLKASYDSIIWRLEGEVICRGKNCIDIVRLNLKPGRYKIDFEIFYKGCSTGEGRDLEVKDISKLVIPNIVSLRSENANDRLTFSSLSGDINIDDIKIYNRWGNVVFQTQNVTAATFEWDLKTNGVYANTNVYVVVVEYTNEKGEKVIEKGDLLILN